jgi:hypothetical protein
MAQDHLSRVTLPSHAFRSPLAKANPMPPALAAKGEPATVRFHGESGAAYLAPAHQETEFGRFQGPLPARKLDLD